MTNQAFPNPISNLLANIEQIKKLSTRPISDAEIFSAAKQYVEAGLCASGDEAIEYMLEILQEPVASPRTLAFRNFATHPHFKRDYAQLSKDQREECERFIAENDQLDASKFAERVNLWKLDKPELRSKKHNTQWGLLLQANTQGTSFNLRNRRNK